MIKRLLLIGLVALCTLARGDEQSDPATALWVRSDSTEAISIARKVLERDKRDVHAAFVAMEASALQADDRSTLDYALQVLDSADGEDPRAEIAVWRVRSLAANSATFRDRLRKLKDVSKKSPEVRLALVAAASDGAPELDILAQSRDAGLLTEWRFAGPFGRHGLIDFDKSFAPETDNVSKKRYDNKKVEKILYADGQFVLPEYLQGNGVYFASSIAYLTNDGDWTVFIESPGMVELRIDGETVLRRDTRAQAGPQLLRKKVRLLRGEHKVLVKFVAAASPFRVAIMPITGGAKRKNNIPLLRATPESEYVRAALPLAQGDSSVAVRNAREFLKTSKSASAHYLLAKAWQSSSEDAPEIRTELEAARKLDTRAVSPTIELASREFYADHTEDGLRLLYAAKLLQPNAETVLKLEAYEMKRLAWQEEASEALGRLAAVHPSCENLLLAVEHFAGIREFKTSRHYEQRLQTCSPNSLAYARILSSRGDHAGATQAAASVAGRFPLDREARELEVRELLLAEKFDPARAVAEGLVDGAPGSAEYSQLLQAANARQTHAVRKSTDELLNRLASVRRNGLDIIEQAKDRRYSGGPALLVLNDQAVLEQGSQRWVYTHRITRMLNREGVLGFGEISVPQDAEVLQLRTIKLSGEIIEPELHDHKATVSMPALAPGDAIEEEYFVAASADEPFRFTFGSFAAPILFSRFSFVGAPTTEVSARLGAPSPTSTPTADGLIARTWEMNEISQPVREASLPRTTLFPTVLLKHSESALDEYQSDALEAFLEASSPGPRVWQLVENSRNDDPRRFAEALFRAVTKAVREGSDDFRDELTSAEASLETGVGSRTATLLACARAAGLDVSLLLGRDQATDDSAEEYASPILSFSFAGKTVYADPSEPRLPFGSLRPQLANNALSVARFEGMRHFNDPGVVALGPSLRNERSVAEADVTISDAGALKANVTITMGPWRGLQMRNVLRTIPSSQRGRFFEQLALRLFAGAANAKGSVTNENDPDKPLILSLSCESPQFADFSKSAVDLDQLTPGLGLRGMYVKSARRQFPMFIDSLLDESTLFRVHLPKGATVRGTAQFEQHGKFGDYSVSVRQTGTSTWEMRREFRIPMQVISPAEYGDFAEFAMKLDSQERERITVVVPQQSKEVVAQLGAE